ncbi:oxidoreductase, short chain dehydrogenase/reductase family protein [Corynebacterium efficiens YS-314]|uniref:Putative reductase n=1 Tax=Corynebacterium efficiens (strain DSM 44549 / YS-314 / AJ 12310 / JCM 11189 / NBRC 100395) TaxID=196164 RepID=Q8FN11_COREF|nr:SDR family oxidoreductase [Corynebacterium efficiens]EEW49004.1 oxidoreductase, short chain dehydrogenase/reductase family protein [Corynebacterium efficiens YS-314]BAC19147.1 putative reductase [Corynebacterium efficiens YS-314]
MSEAVAVVTGATGGMGVEIVRDLARDHRVYALGRNAGVLAQLEGIDNVVAVETDIVSDLLGDNGAGIPQLPDLRRVDVLVHAAAIAHNRSVESATVRDWHDHLDLNVVVPAELTRQLLPALRAAQGQIVFINSGAGTGAHPGNTIYSASKHALRGLADALRREESVAGVRVSTVSPGPTDTPMLRGLVEDKGGEYRPEWYIEPVEVARAIRFVVDAGETTQITNVDVRPRVELADRN